MFVVHTNVRTRLLISRSIAIVNSVKLHFKRRLKEREREILPLLFTVTGIPYRDVEHRGYACFRHRCYIIVESYIGLPCH